MSPHEKRIIKSENAPKPVGPYSVGVWAGPFIFTAGQIGLDPKSGNLVEGGIEAETRQVMKNLNSILCDGGSSFNSVVKATVFLKDMADFARMNAIYVEYFKDNPPARSAVQVTGLPKGAMVEIELIALKEESACGCGSK
jgi:2-iminobutanoate/2-iminopropanoate deaminase